MSRAVSELRARWILQARAAGRWREVAALEAAEGDALPRLVAAEATSAIEGLHREREEPIGSPWRRS